MKMSKASSRRERWFTLGADAVQRLRPDFPRLYICPLCGYGYSERALATNELTLEDVPPKSLGGKPLVLTCRRCNSKAGHETDIHALNREKVIDFARGTLSKPLRARLSHEGVTSSVDVTSVGKSLLVVGNPELTAPENRRELESKWEQSAQKREALGTFSLELTGARYNHRSALVSYLRAAYLAAFAVWGYKYIFHPKLKATVREYLLHPESETLRIFSMTRPDDDKVTRWMMLVEEPVELQSFMVSFGRHAVFLPWPPSNIGLYDYLMTKNTNKLSSLKIHGKRLFWDWEGQRITWPRQPIHALDWGWDNASAIDPG